MGFSPRLIITGKGWKIFFIVFEPSALRRSAPRYATKRFRIFRFATPGRSNTEMFGYNRIGITSTPLPPPPPRLYITRTRTRCKAIFPRPISIRIRYSNTHMYTNRTRTLLRCSTYARVRIKLRIVNRFGTDYVLIVPTARIVYNATRCRLYCSAMFSFSRRAIRKCCVWRMFTSPDKKMKTKKRHPSYTYACASTSRSV
jgi:hypothetical protein